MLQDLLADFSDPFANVPMQVAVMRLLAAVVLGGAIGWERERRNRPAGLRTHMMISLAACLFTLIAFELMTLSISPDTEENMRFDPLRLIEAVTAGVAFLAAGSIITSGGKVRGLTTGAGMWMAGAIGLACGTGRLSLAILATVVAVIVLWLLRYLSQRIAPQDTTD